MFKYAVSCDCGYFHTTGNEYFVCPKCNSVCYDRDFQVKIGYLHERYLERTLMNFGELYHSLDAASVRLQRKPAELISIEYAFERKLYSYRVEVYEDRTSVQMRTAECTSDRVLCPTAIVVRDSKTLKIRAIWRNMGDVKFLQLPSTTYQIPNVVLSMSNKDVKFVTGLNTVSLATIYETGRLFRGATVPKDATVADIVKLVEENAFRFLPKYSTLDLDRQPPMDQVIVRLVAENPNIVFAINHKTFGRSTIVSRNGLPTRTADPHQLLMRWISYYSPDATSVLDPYSYAPFNTIPENGAMLSIPIKRDRDRYLRKFDDDYRLFLQVIHRDMKS